MYVYFYLINNFQFACSLYLPDENVLQVIGQDRLVPVDKGRVRTAPQNRSHVQERLQLRHAVAQHLQVFGQKYTVRVGDAQRQASDLQSGGRRRTEHGAFSQLQRGQNVDVAFIVRGGRNGEVIGEFALRRCENKYQRL